MTALMIGLGLGLGLGVGLRRAASATLFALLN